MYFRRRTSTLLRCCLSSCFAVFSFFFFILCLAPKSILASVILLRGFSKLRFAWLKLVLIAAQSCFVEGSKLLVSPHAMSRLFKLQRYSCFTYTTPLFLLYIVCLAPKSCSNRAYFIYTSRCRLLCKLILSGLRSKRSLQMI